MDEELRQAVMAGSRRPDVLDAMAAHYASLQRAIDVRRPICNASGRCCHFEEFGHRLYVTTMELARFVADLSAFPHSFSDTAGSTLSIVQDPSRHALPIISGMREPERPDPGGCPFQVEGLCSVHAFRPFGCRVFFCDASAEEWQHEQYEQHHARLRRMHGELDIPYFYIEWRAALNALGLPTPSREMP